MSRPLIQLLDRAAPLAAQIVAWWDALRLRERVLIGILASAVASALLFTLLIDPVRSWRRDALTTIRLHETLQGGLQAAGTGGDTPQRSGDPAMLASASAAQFGLTLVQVTPEGSGIRVDVAPARFEELLRWIAEMERTTPLRTAAVDVRRGDVSGTVTGKVILVP